MLWNNLMTNFLKNIRNATLKIKKTFLVMNLAELREVNISATVVKTDH